MITPKQLIQSFYKGKAEFFNTLDGESWVEVYDVNRFIYVKHRVNRLARNIIKHKRWQQRIKWDFRNECYENAKVGK